ncbi:hypothetical protein [Halobacillus litoralis]|uniref:hypothetical protein n=1 Tax=Halobacillus litoralis TaxID=45668 RepID=UPI001CD429F9|nr:hypothetical protein [Halobacillus litoralis]MCA1021571.1 hypothetical protein [Halobacillus litoralis]
MKKQITIKDPKGTISAIEISKHPDGIWFETNMNEYVVLPKDSAVDLVNTLIDYIFE